MEIAIIVATDQNNGIGIDNQLLCHLPNDLKYFKRITNGFAILMGRKTYDSIGKPLPNRLNLVVSKTIAYMEGCEMFSDIPSAIDFADEKGLNQLFIIGGDSIYKQSMDMCSKIYLTRIHHSFQADAHFPELDKSIWKLISSESHAADEKNTYPHTFEVYERIGVQES